MFIFLTQSLVHTPGISKTTMVAMLTNTLPGNIFNPNTEDKAIRRDSELK